MFLCIGCHYHPTDASLSVMEGRYFFKLHSSPEVILQILGKRYQLLIAIFMSCLQPMELQVGDQIVTPKWQPHAEGNPGTMSLKQNFYEGPQMSIFTCGEAGRSRRGKFFFLLLILQKTT